MGTKKLNNHIPTIKTNQDGFNSSTPMSGQDYPMTNSPNKHGKACIAKSRENY